jgi:putative oxidoreductase
MFSSKPFALNTGLLIIRVIVGGLIAYHGIEVFDPTKMQEYTKWEMFSNSSLMPYIGKGAEFVAGILLMLGLLTRAAALIIIGTFLYICFFIGNGKFWYEDQHPFLFALFGFLFLFTGSGSYSLDNLLFKKK